MATVAAAVSCCRGEGSAATRSRKLSRETDRLPHAGASRRLSHDPDRDAECRRPNMPNEESGKEGNALPEVLVKLPAPSAPRVRLDARFGRLELARRGNCGRSATWSSSSDVARLALCAAKPTSREADMLVWKDEPPTKQCNASLDPPMGVLGASAVSRKDGADIRSSVRCWLEDAEPESTRAMPGALSAEPRRDPRMEAPSNMLSRSASRKEGSLRHDEALGVSYVTVMVRSSTKLGGSAPFVSLSSCVAPRHSAKGAAAGGVGWDSSSHGVSRPMVTGAPTLRARRLAAQVSVKSARASLSCFLW
mmetsp:Transcript_23232/g.45079  ORF Transcript_23232/g.45079 Transcript_23232/m.45079 type:complete len:307 (+) Transcript_23232:943-1863(+)